MKINGYTLKAELKNADSGFSKWGFATKNGKEYFIKELINPVYPIDKNVMSEELFEQRRAFCSQYENKFRLLFNQINKVSKGNLIRINEFFRCGSRYYLITEKVDGKTVSIDYISSLVEDKKLLLLKTVAHCFYDLHSAGIVHFDVKPNNILVKKLKNGNYVAKLIDFDSGFFKGEVLDNKELGGDLTYLAPETFLGICGEKVVPDEKADIFGLGLVFHEYYCGKLPFFDTNKYEYPYEAALDGSTLTLDMGMLPDNIGSLITSMLNVDPKKRPSAERIIKELNIATNQPEEKCCKIKTIMIHFGGAFGKTIVVSEDAIKYRNTVDASVKSEIEDQKECYPSDYLTQKKRPIAKPSVFERIIGSVVNAGLWDLIKPSKDSEFRSDIVCQTIMCVCEDSSTYSYSTDGEQDKIFNSIISILSKYCDFPQKKSMMDENKENKTDGGWFTPAGDL